MTSFSKIPLSGSTDGKGILVSGTDTGSADTIHTAQASATDADVVTLYAMNSDVSPQALTILWGGTASPDDEIIVQIPSLSGLTLVIPDLILRNSLVVKAFAAVTDVVSIHGYVNRIS